MRCSTVSKLCKALHPLLRPHYDNCDQLLLSKLRSYSTSSQTLLEGKQERGSSSHYIRARGEKSLPLPPVLNPSIIAARKRYRLPKAKPLGKERTVFQQKLYRNVYAWALASKPRSCRASAIRIPAYFTITYHPGIDPETSALVYLPSKMVRQVGLNVRLLATYDNIAEASTRADYITSRMTPHWLDKKNKPKWPKNMPDQTMEMLRFAVKRSLKWALKHPKTGLIEDCKGATDIEDKQPNKDEIEWDGDQIHPRSAGPAAILYLVSTSPAAFKLSKQCGNIEKELEIICHEIEKLQRKLNGKGKPKESRYRNMTMARSLPLDQLQEKFPVVWHQAPAFEGRRDDIDHQQQSQADLLGNLETKYKPVPVYDLTYLLGEEGTRELVQDTAFKDANCLVLKDVRLNLEGQMHLYKLQGYLRVIESSHSEGN